MNEMLEKLKGLLQDPEIRECLKAIIKYEEREEARRRSDPIYKDLDTTPYWELLDIPVEWKHVRKLIYAGIVRKVAKRWYILTDREKAKEMLETYEALTSGEEVPTEVGEVPEDLFDVIEGFDDLKWWFKKTLEADKPVHTLLVGPPGVAKSLFLLELSRVPGGMFVTAGTSSKVGLRDILVERRPRLLLVDEIEKITSPLDLSVLLTMMESQKVVVAIHKRYEEVQVKCSVVAAANTLKRLPIELIDRFQVFHIKPYTPEQAKRILVRYLVEREGVKPDLAKYIAEKVTRYTTSVREGIRLARICETKEDVDRVLSILRKYSA